MSLPTFSFETTAQEVASALKDQILGKNVLITGTSLNGLGFETARAVAPYASLVVITGYDAERLALSKNALIAEFASANIRTLTLNLASLASIRKAVAEVNEYPEPLHVLVNNAVATGDFYMTEDDFEIQMAVAQFGPFLFTKLVTPKLQMARTATYIPRVVYLGSVAHKMGLIPGLDWDNLRYGFPAEEAGTPETIMKRYCETKTAAMLMAVELGRRAKGQLRAYSVHPGAIATNVLSKPAMKAIFLMYGMINEDGTPKEDGYIKWKSLSQGAATIVVAAFDPRLDDKSGAYLVDGNVATDEDIAPHAVDPANAAKLWGLTEEILGDKWEL